jgi:hypothetical protein
VLFVELVVTKATMVLRSKLLEGMPWTRVQGITRRRWVNHALWAIHLFKSMFDGIWGRGKEPPNRRLYSWVEKRVFLLNASLFQARGMISMSRRGALPTRRWNEHPNVAWTTWSNTMPCDNIYTNWLIAMVTYVWFDMSCG